MTLTWHGGEQRVAFPAIKYFGFRRWARMCLTVLGPELCVVWPLSTTEEVVGASVFWFLAVEQPATGPVQRWAPNLLTQDKENSAGR